MAELKESKLSPDSHILIDQSLLRLPSELSRNNLKTAQYHIEASQKKVTALVQAAAKSSATAAVTGGSEDASVAAITSLDQVLSNLEALKAKLTALNTSSVELHAQSTARVQHLQDLYEISSLADVKYDEWSRVRLDRLLVDYLCRMGYNKSARELAQQKGIEKLVDLDEFERIQKVDRSLVVERRVDLALEWCKKNGGSLKKMGNTTLEYELRLQQYIELVRTGFESGEMSKFHEARTHAAKYLASHRDAKWKSQAAVLLAIAPDTEWEPYNALYSPIRWIYLSKIYLETHHTMFNLPWRPLLHVALTAGLSALKTPACHSKFTSPSSGLNSNTTSTLSDQAPEDIINSPLAGTSATLTSLTTSVCPICSTELNQLARRVPFAHHTKSNFEHDPVVLPNGRIYGRERLFKLNVKMGVKEGFVKDPADLTKVCRWEDVRKVFIS